MARTVNKNKVNAVVEEAKNSKSPFKVAFFAMLGIVAAQIVALGILLLGLATTAAVAYNFLVIQ